MYHKHPSSVPFPTRPFSDWHHLDGLDYNSHLGQPAWSVWKLQPALSGRHLVGEGRPMLCLLEEKVTKCITFAIEGSAMHVCGKPC